MEGPQTLDDRGLHQRPFLLWYEGRIGHSDVRRNYFVIGIINAPPLVYLQADLFWEKDTEAAIS